MERIGVPTTTFWKLVLYPLSYEGDEGQPVSLCAERLSSGMKRTARPAASTSTMATVGPSSSSSGDVAVPGLR